ncbi:MAG: Lrp/AsnC family transcriptional regulator [archaeon]
MKKQDLIVLSALRQNARLSLTKMSRATRVPVSTIYDKLRQYERDIIKKHTAIVDFAKLGYNTRAKILLKVERNQREKVQEYLSKNGNVNSIYKINNGYDYLVEMIFVHIKDMEDFMENLESQFKVLKQETYYVIADLKKEEFLSNPNATIIATVEDPIPT